MIGPSGAGKSSLARAIGGACGLPVFHLDRLYWQPGWREPDRTEFRAKVQAVAARPAWVIDGGYHSSLDLRLPRATHLIWLDLPRRIYALRAVRRILTYHGRQRPDVGEGCPEWFDRDFLFDWVWRYPTHGQPRDKRVFEALPPTIRGIRLATRANVRQFIAQLPTSLTDET
ncbi:MAG: topology modulation protein [Hyphomicrobiaceae bacterium]